MCIRDSSTYEALFIKNNVAGYPAITNESSPDTIELRSGGSVQATIDYNSNDTDKYFRVMANGQSSSGTELFRVQEDGKVGIDKSNPAEMLDVTGSVQASGGFKTAGHPVVTYASFSDISGGSYATRLGSTGTSTLRSTQIYGGGGHIATFDGVNKRLGINETSPDDRIEIRTTAHGQGVTIKSTGNTSNALTFDANRGTQGVIGVVYGRWNGTTVAQMNFVSGDDGTDKNDGYITFGTESAASNGNVNATERLRIDSSGFIHQKFTSDNSTTAEGLFINNKNNSTGNNASLIFSNDGGERKKASISYIDTGAYGTGDMVFALDNDADSGALHVTNHERVRITKDGKIGINRTDPDQRICINGSAEFNAYDSTGGSGGYYTSKGLIIGNAYDAGKAGSVSDDRNSIVWNERGLDIDFATSDTLRVKIDYSGNFLVGRTNTITIASDPSNACFEQLTDNAMPLTIHCNQTNKRGLGVYYTSGGTPADFIRCQITTSPKFLVTGNGNTQNANNSYGSISDISLKENIVDANSQWDDIKNIKVRNFNFKESTGQETYTQIGVIAQEIETVSPKLVSTPKEGIKTVKSSVLYMKAVKALQEAQARIETLEAKVSALEGS